jgi:hypothetical protein
MLSNIVCLRFQLTRISCSALKTFAKFIIFLIIIFLIILFLIIIFLIILFLIILFLIILFLIICFRATLSSPKPAHCLAFARHRYLTRPPPHQSSNTFHILGSPLRLCQSS